MAAERVKPKVQVDLDPRHPHARLDRPARAQAALNCRRVDVLGGDRQQRIAAAQNEQYNMAERSSRSLPRPRYWNMSPTTAAEQLR